MSKLRISLSLALATLMAAPAAYAIRIPTNYGNGADAEVRESNPTRKAGFNTELASRIRSEVDPVVEELIGTATDRSSFFYLRFDTDMVSEAEIATAPTVALELTYRNTNLGQGRVEQIIVVDDPDGVPESGDEVTETKRAGLNFWALNVGHAGNDWIEDDQDPNGIDYSNAPGILPDNDIGTIDIDPSQMTFLGQQDFPDVTPANHLPVGGKFSFSSPALTQHLLDAKAAGQDLVTFAVSVSHDGDTAFNTLTNFNYLFNPKEMVTLNDDPSYNPDPANIDPNPGSPWSGADNSTGAFSPTLAIVPEPTSIALLGLGGLGLTLLRRRR